MKGNVNDDDDALAIVRGEKMSPSLLGTEGHKFYTFMPLILIQLVGGGSEDSC